MAHINVMNIHIYIFVSFYFYFVATLLYMDIYLFIYFFFPIKSTLSNYTSKRRTRSTHLYTYSYGNFRILRANITSFMIDFLLKISKQMDITRATLAIYILYISGYTYHVCVKEKSSF